MHIHRLPATLSFLLCTAATHAGLQAQPIQRDPVAAETLFQDARSLMDRRVYSEACPKLVESQRLDPGVGTLMYLALCYEESGRTASAWSIYRSAESAAINARQTERATIARDRARALEPKLSKIVIRVTADAPHDLRVLRDGVELGRAIWGTKMPVDPGTHAISASASGRSSWSSTFVAPAEGGDLIIDVPTLALAHTNSVRTVAVSSPASTALTQKDSGPSNRGDMQRWLGLGACAVGLTGAAVGTYLMLDASNKSAEAEKFRRPGTSIYDGGGYDLNQQALERSRLGAIGLVVAGTALVGGALLYFTASPKSPRATALVVDGGIGFGGASLTLSGGWQ